MSYVGNVILFVTQSSLDISLMVNKDFENNLIFLKGNFTVEQGEKVGTLS